MTKTPWTTELLKKLYLLWNDDNETVKSIADKIGKPRTSISGMKSRMVKSGFKMVKKYQSNYINALLEDLKKEMKIR